MFYMVGIVTCIGIIAWGAFCVVRRLVILWTGSNKEEATRLIQSCILQNPSYRLANDPIVFSEMDNAVHCIVGDSRYEDLCILSQTVQLITSGVASGLPYISVTVNYSDKNEKIRLEKILKNIVVKYLTIHGLPAKIRTTWMENQFVKMPALYIYYAETEEQRKALTAWIQADSAKIINKAQPLKEEESFSDDDRL